MAVVSHLLATALLATGCAQADDRAADDSARAQQVVEDTTSVARVDGVKGRRVEVVAVGDIACEPSTAVTATTCRHRAVARLTKRIDPEALLALGDLQYQSGTLWAFRNSYKKSWGDLRGITYPTPGNHEYYTAGAKGYYRFFSHRIPDSPGYYAFDLGRWRAYAVNDNCDKIDCDKQVSWLRQDLRDHPVTCSLITTHVPRYSTGEHGDDTSMRRFFRIAHRNGVDLMLAGHDHHYERFKRMNHRGELRKRGVMQFVSGGGGKSHYAADGAAKGSEYVEDDTFGVLRLVLRPESFRYGFRGIDGSRQDNGTRDCV